ncbi:MAG TPA: YIP1 family protein [Pyrinomonadaceae bacterium]|nr:YIP1 family protein [Pyrinomonadaceae bacterium]
MNRIVAIAVLVVGLLLLIGGVLKILPGAAGGGGALAFLGIVMLGLSFIRRDATAAGDAPPMSEAEKIASVFYEPARVFQELRARPYWGTAFLIIALSVAVYQFAYTQRIGAETIALATIDKTVEGGFIPAERAAEMRERTAADARQPFTKMSGAINGVVGVFVIMAILAGLYMLGVLVSGARIKFWQAFSVAVFAGLPVIVLQNLISLLLLFLKSPDDIEPLKGQRGLARADLGVLFNPAENPYLFVLGSSIGLFTLYGIWLTATGLRHSGEKVTSGTAWAISIGLWAFGLLLGLGAAALFPTFIT